MLLALVLVTVGMVVTVALWQKAVAFNDAVSSQSALSSQLWGPLGGDERVNVLLIGHSPEGRDGAFLADSMTVLSIDPSDQSTTAISIPRDLWIEGNPGLPANGKINEAFAIGYRDGGFDEAGSLTTRVIASVSGLHLDGWISVDFEGLREMVDAVGGITIRNPRSFRWTMGPDQLATGEWVNTFPAGDLTLDGVDALRFARVRYTDIPEEASDFARSARQQLILAGIREKIDLSIEGIPRAIRLSDALVGDLHTDLSVIDLGLMASHLTADRRIELAEGVILEATRNSAGQYVLVVIGRSGPSDYQPLRDYIRTRLAQPSSGP